MTSGPDQHFTASGATTVGTTAMNTSTIAEAHRVRRRHAHELPTSVPRAADDPGAAALAPDHRDRQRGYRVCPGHLPTTRLTITGRIVTTDLDALRPEPNPSTGRSLRLTVGADRGRIEVRRRRSPT